MRENNVLYVRETKTKGGGKNGEKEKKEEDFRFVKTIVKISKT